LESGILAVVKANAYGHGVLDVVKVLAEDTEVFGVANIKEALEVSGVGTRRDIMLLSPCLPAEREEAVRNRFIVTVSSAEEAQAFARHGEVRVNFKIDTGMGRAGCDRSLALDEVRAGAWLGEGFLAQHFEPLALGG
jgi:alanine racemase